MDMFVLQVIIVKLLGEFMVLAFGFARLMAIVITLIGNEAMIVLVPIIIALDDLQLIIIQWEIV